MSELVDKDAFLKQERKWYCENCDRRKGVKNGRKCFVYEIGEVPCRACDVDDVLDDLEDFPAASPWHRVEEPPEEEGKYFVAYRSSVVDGWGYDTAYYTKHLEDKMLMIPVPENSEGWFNWSGYHDCDVLVCPDYWMSPPEPPKEEADADK